MTEAFEIAFDQLGNVETLTEGARSNPSEFYKLYARLIPVEQQVSGTDSSPVQIV